MTTVSTLPTGTPAGSGKPRVLVLFGGRSSEHAVSCVTAAGVLEAIDRTRYDVVPVGITRSGQWSLVSADPSAWSLRSDVLPEVTATEHAVVMGSAADGGTGQELLIAAPGSVPESLGGVDVVLPLLHGPFGEDGTLQGMLEMADMRYVGAGVLASAVGMDKHYMKVVFEAAGLDVGPYDVVTDRQWRTDPEAGVRRAAALGFPLFVKPRWEGTAKGIGPHSRVDDADALAAVIVRPPSVGQLESSASVDNALLYCYDAIHEGFVARAQQGGPRRRSYRRGSHLGASRAAFAKHASLQVPAVLWHARRGARTVRQRARQRRPPAHPRQGRAVHLLVH